MNIIKTFRKALFILKINFYKINKSFNEIENYDKYIEKKLLIKSVTIDKVVNGVLTISIPKSVKNKVYNIMLVSE